ncbi:mucin-2 isoform X1 [Drosophila nasuta]|uniref:mucin-2 isoform X1 n=1 Tax=Drosophila nasuta TaxID=42062 RepID=UPI00295E7FBD|nr:mucin-2 isoform X1 [Drosophila nasuta]
MSISYCAILLLAFAICGSISTPEVDQNNAGVASICPPDHYLYNNLCYRNNRCPVGYYLGSDGMCYIIEPKPCPADSTTTTTTTTEAPSNTEVPITTEEPNTTEESTTTTTEEPITTEEPTTTEETTTTTTTEVATTSTTEEPTTSTTEEPIIPTTTEETIIAPAEQVRCPQGSIFMNEQCRKIICTQGEYFEGRCLSPACPVGTVWRNKQCLEPGYITTILEIDNVVKNSHVYRTNTENIHRVEYETVKPYDPSSDFNFDTTTTSRPVVQKTTTSSPLPPPPAPLTKEPYPGEVPPDGCCLVKSPRFCRPYPPTWVCINHSKKICDARICTRPLIYLKPPQVVELTNPPLLVMPPTPPLSACATPDCQESDLLNCSGCALGKRESCSTGCYNYYCPNGNCALKKSEEFCALYPGGFGCNHLDGCIWDWCTEKCH